MKASLKSFTRPSNIRVVHKGKASLWSEVLEDYPALENPANLQQFKNIPLFINYKSNSHVFSPTTAWKALSKVAETSLRDARILWEVAQNVLYYSNHNASTHREATDWFKGALVAAEILHNAPYASDQLQLLTDTQKDLAAKLSIGASSLEQLPHVLEVITPEQALKGLISLQIQPAQTAQLTQISKKIEFIKEKLNGRALDTSLFTANLKPSRVSPSVFELMSQQLPDIKNITLEPYKSTLQKQTDPMLSYTLEQISHLRTIEKIANKTFFSYTPSLQYKEKKGEEAFQVVVEYLKLHITQAPPKVQQVALKWVHEQQKKFSASSFPKNIHTQWTHLCLSLKLELSSTQDEKNCSNYTEHPLSAQYTVKPVKTKI